MTPLCGNEMRDRLERIELPAQDRPTHDEQNDEILRFAEAWRERTGELPAELVFDSRLTTYANLARLNQMGIAFLTLRRRTAKMVAELLAVPPAQWRKVRLANVGRIYRTPRILERTVRLLCWGE